MIRAKQISDRRKKERDVSGSIYMENIEFKCLLVIREKGRVPSLFQRATAANGARVDPFMKRVIDSVVTVSS